MGEIRKTYEIEEFETHYLEAHGRTIYGFNVVTNKCEDIKAGDSILVNGEPRQIEIMIWADKDKGDLTVVLVEDKPKPKKKSMPDTIPLITNKNDQALIDSHKAIMEKYNVPPDRMGWVAQIAENQLRHEAKLRAEGKSVITEDAQEALSIKEPEPQKPTKLPWWTRLWNWISKLWTKKK